MSTSPPPLPPPPPPPPAGAPAPPPAGPPGNTARRTHPVSIVFEVLGVGVRDVIFFGILIVSTGFWWLVPVGIVVGLVVSTLRWQRRTWSFDGSHVVVDTGLFQRSHREIPVDRIQQVELVRRLRHQLLGVTTLRIETSGGPLQSEVNLSVLAAAEAEAVRTTLLRARDRARATGSPAPAPGAVGGALAGAEPGPEPGEPPAHVLVTLPTRRLLLAGLTGPQLIALPIALVWLLDLAGDLAVTPDVDADRVVTAGAVVVAFVVFALVVLWLGVAVIAGVISYHGLEVSLVGSDLRIRRGLFDRRDVSIPLPRVQSVSLHAHPLHRALGLTDLHISSAGQATGVPGLGRGVVPVLDPAQVEYLLGVVLPEAHPVPDLEPAPRRALPRHIVAPVLWALVLTVAALLVDPIGLGVVALVPLAVVYGVADYRALGAGRTDRVVVTRQGAVLRRTDVVPLRKLQSVRTTATILQRRRALADVALDIGGRGAAVLVDRDAGEAEHLLHTLTRSAAPREEEAAHREHGPGGAQGAGAGDGAGDGPGGPRVTAPNGPRTRLGTSRPPWHDDSPVQPP